MERASRPDVTVTKHHRIEMAFLGRLFCFVIGAAALNAGVLFAVNASAISNVYSVSMALEELGSGELGTSRIELESLGSGDAALQIRLDGIARGWNDGDRAAAVTAVRALEFQGAAFALGVSRMSPKTTTGVNGTAISTHPASFNVHLDYHAPTGTLFAAIQDIDNDNSWYYWRMYMSADGGRTWSETYAWGSSVPIVDIGAAVVGDYFYVAYLTESHAETARVRRSLVTTGEGDISFSWLEVFDVDNAIVNDVELTSNQEANNNRLYLFSVLSDGRLIYFYTDEEGGGNPDFAWTELSTGVTNAAGNLDLAYDDRDPAGAIGGYLFAAYRTMASTIDVFRFINPFPEKDVTEIAPWFHDGPRISAYRNHVVVVYGADNSAYVGANMAVSADSGDMWDLEILDGGVDGDVAQAVVTARGGGGVRIVYQRNLTGDDLPFFRAGHYEETFLSTPAAASGSGLTLGSKMDLEGPGLISLHDGDIPYFDRIPPVFLNGFELGDTLDWEN